VQTIEFIHANIEKFDHAVPPRSYRRTTSPASRPRKLGRSRRISPPRSLSLTLTLSLTLILNQGGEILRERRKLATVNPAAADFGQWGVLEVAQQHCGLPHLSSASMFVKYADGSAGCCFWRSVRHGSFFEHSRLSL